MPTTDPRTLAEAVEYGATFTLGTDAQPHRWILRRDYDNTAVDLTAEVANPRPFDLSLLPWGEFTRYTYLSQTASPEIRSALAHLPGGGALHLPGPITQHEAAQWLRGYAAVVQDVYDRLTRAEDEARDYRDMQSAVRRFIGVAE